MTKICSEQYPELILRLKTSENRNSIAKDFSVSGERIRQIAKELNLPTAAPKAATPKIPQKQLRQNVRHCEISWDYKVPERVVAEQRHKIGVFRGNKAGIVAKRLSSKTYVKHLHNLNLNSTDIAARYKNLNDAQVKRDRGALGIKLQKERVKQTKAQGKYAHVYVYSGKPRAYLSHRGKNYQVTANTENEAAQWADMILMYIKKKDPVNFPRGYYKTRVRNQVKAWFKEKGWL